jgi:putative AbiEi antitoxin of type IV toxin-antitoxin system
MESAGASRVAVRRQMHPQTSDHRIAELGQRQHGVVGRYQLLNAGISAGEIRWRLASGRLHPVFPGAYAVGVPATSIAAIRVAAMLSTAPSFISNRDAAEEHALVIPIPGAVHVTIAHGWRLRREGIVVHRTRHLHRDERVKRGPLRLTSPARTLVDIAAGMTRGAADRNLRRADPDRGLHRRAGRGRLPTLERPPRHRAAARPHPREAPAVRAHAVPPRAALPALLR